MSLRDARHLLDRVDEIGWVHIAQDGSSTLYRSSAISDMQDEWGNEDLDKEMDFSVAPYWLQAAEAIPSPFYGPEDVQEDLIAHLDADDLAYLGMDDQLKEMIEADEVRHPGYALFNACKFGNSRCAELLLPLVEDRDIAPALELSIKNGNLECAQVISDFKDRHPLHTSGIRVHPDLGERSIRSRRM
ncbi:ankyrin repeat domain-containing protein [Pseudoxanthomonas winnipegensis]|uniref:ankyrin repeat domain-containing protein n=1 Tax=Pseudoxanthomonas winnipegensis TaxID=2480810 RepID=UPI00103F970E|nr:ankyrin repeat domain-containing protein [Pseudoxanthomonas winnipegensis]TBV69745.1 hypothetical protein EYC45_19035 [Pseudoxanthomonas winnipegensis]